MGQLSWYIARSGGIVAWALVTASVLWGLALSTKVTGGRVRRPWMLDLHRFLGAAGVVFVGIHVLALVADTYVHFGLADVLVPFVSGWRTTAVAWGVIAMWLAVAVEVSSLLRRHLPRKVWRGIHFTAFAVFASSTLHGLTAGTDASAPALRLTMAAATVAVAGLTGLRIFQATSTPAAPARTTRPARPAAPTAPAAPPVDWAPAFGPAPAPVASQIAPVSPEPAWLVLDEPGTSTAPGGSYRPVSARPTTHRSPTHPQEAPRAHHT